VVLARDAGGRIRGRRRGGGNNYLFNLVLIGVVSRDWF